MEEQHPEQYAEEEQGGGQVDGAFARVNGGMLQSGKFSDQIVSLVGQITAHDTIRTADGSEVRVNTEHLQDEEGNGLIVDPNLVVEIMGQASGPTEITAFIRRELGTDMDLGLYNQLIMMQQDDKYFQYFVPAPEVMQQ